MIHFKQEGKGLAVDVKTTATDTKVSLDLLGGGRADLIIPGKHEIWHSAAVQRIEVKITLEIDVPNRVDLFDSILVTQGQSAALDYARRELAK